MSIKILERDKYEVVFAEDTDLFTEYHFGFNIYSNKFVFFTWTWRSGEDKQKHMKDMLKLFNIYKEPTIIRVGPRSVRYGITLTYEEYMNFCTLLQLKGIKLWGKDIY